VSFPAEQRDGVVEAVARGASWAAARAAERDVPQLPWLR